MKDRLAGNGDPSLVRPDVIVAVAKAKRGREQPQATARLPVENALSFRVVGDGLAEIKPGSNHREVSESGGWDEPDRALSFPARVHPVSGPSLTFGAVASARRPVFEAAGGPIHGSGRIVRIQSAKDAMKPRYRASAGARSRFRKCASGCRS